MVMLKLSVERLDKMFIKQAREELGKGGCDELGKGGCDGGNPSRRSKFKEQ